MSPLQNSIAIPIELILNFELLALNSFLVV